MDFKFTEDSMKFDILLGAFVILFLALLGWMMPPRGFPKKP